MSDSTYEAVVTALEKRYEKTITAQAARLVREHGMDGDGRDEARELLSSYLLNDTDWEPVAAADISDIAYEAVEQAVRATREAAWAADRQMVSDMERDGLL